MLVLSRKVGEKLVIDGRITVVVTRVVGNRVTLGVDAPADVHVLRGELREDLQAGARGQRLAAPAVDRELASVEIELADPNVPVECDRVGSSECGSTGTVVSAVIRGAVLPGDADAVKSRPPLAALTAAVLAAHAATST